MGAKQIDFSAERRKIVNAFSEDGAQVREAILDVLDKIEGADKEYDKDEVAQEVQAAIAETLEKQIEQQVAEKVAEGLAKRVAELRDSIANVGSANKVSTKVQNEICRAIFNATTKESVKSDVEAVMVRNGITGLTFDDVVDFAIVDGWGDSDPLFAMLKKVPFTKFFYTEQDLTDATARAKQWNSANAAGVKKSVQELQVKGKGIDTDYVYKILDVAFKDLDNIRRSGKEAYLERWINEELDRQIVNTIMYHILAGEDANTGITTFETLAASAADAFVGAANVAATNLLANVATEVAKLNRKAGQKAVLVLNPATEIELRKHLLAAGGDVTLYTRDELKGLLGVDEIFTYNYMPAGKVVAFIPDEYWVHEENAISVAYPVYIENRKYFQKERNIGGAIHGLMSAVNITINAD